MPKRGNPVHVATTRRHYKGKVYETHLLRRSYREGGKVKNETLGNLSHLPAELIDLLRRALAGERFISLEQWELGPGLPHGHVIAVLGMMKRLGLEKLLAAEHSRQRDLVLGMIAARLLEPASKLATSRLWKQSTLAAELSIEDADEDELYAAMDWLLARQDQIEKRLARRHLKSGALVLYDLSSSYMEGRHCSLAHVGYSRDGKKGTLQIEYGLITDAEGRPVAVEVFAGNTGDPATVANQVQKLKQRFGLEQVVLVSDRGMLTSARLRELEKLGGVGWITALRAPQIQALVDSGSLQLSIFDERNLAEIKADNYPGERLVVCKNPLLAQERTRKREDLLRATEAKLAPIQERVKEGKLGGKDQIGLAVGKVIDRHKMAKHFLIEILENGLQVWRKQASIEAEAALDGIYVLRTSVTPEGLESGEVVRAYKLLVRVERAFRSFKSIDLQVRPIRHWAENRVRAHIFLCMLAYYVQWHLEQSWAPLLFKDDEPAPAADPVAPAQRSAKALRKARTQRLEDGSPVHSFRTLLGELKTLTRSRILPPDAPTAAIFDKVSTPTPFQVRALALLGLSVQPHP